MMLYLDTSVVVKLYVEEVVLSEVVVAVQEAEACDVADCVCGKTMAGVDRITCP